MPDLLTHVLVVYVLATVLSWRAPWFPSAFVPVGMVGTVLPDLAKVELLLSPAAVEALLGVPFSWYPLHRLGGVVALAGLGALVIDRPDRRRAFAVLLGGATVHLVLDALIRRASGVTPPYLYPLSWWHPPAGGLYLSADAWPAAVSAVLAVAVWAYGRRRSGESAGE